MATDRKTEILRAAIELIADEGYGSLSMRALARASGMKLGALQYHFRTWDALLVALVAYIESEIIAAFESGVGELEQPLLAHAAQRRRRRARRQQRQPSGREAGERRVDTLGREQRQLRLEPRRRGLGRLVAAAACPGLGPSAAARCQLRARPIQSTSYSLQRLYTTPSVVLHDDPCRLIELDALALRGTKK